MKLPTIKYASGLEVSLAAFLLKMTSLDVGQARRRSINRERSSISGAETPSSRRPRAERMELRQVSRQSPGTVWREEGRTHEVGGPVASAVSAGSQEGKDVLTGSNEETRSRPRPRRRAMHRPLNKQNRRCRFGETNREVQTQRLGQSSRLAQSVPGRVGLLVISGVSNTGRIVSCAS